MSDNTEKTIPYRLSEAELENLRILRKRTHTSQPVPDGAEKEDVSLEMDARRSASVRADSKVNSTDAS